MTTNITPIEAIEKILVGCSWGTISTEKSNWLANKIIDGLEQKGFDIATQALAPQECDSDLDYYKNYSKKQLLAEIKLLADEQLEYEKEIQILKEAKIKFEESEIYLIYKANKSFLEEITQLRGQLHSQQKTFTVEEIKEIIHNITDDNQTQTINPNILCKIQTDLLAEFEKEAE